MQHPTQFLEEIRANPDDDAPRLVYADWLEEQGNPRAEFIRVQVELSRFEGPFSRKRALQLREAELWHKHRHEWDCGISTWASRVNFERGFLQYFSCSAEGFAQEGESILNREPVYQVHVPILGRHASKLAQCPALGKLHGLSFYHAHLAHHHVIALLKSPFLNQLKFLNLGMADISFDGYKDLFSGPWPELRQLNLRGASSFNIHLLMAKISNLPKLEELNVSCCINDGERLTPEVLSPLGSQLTKLEFQRNILNFWSYLELANSDLLSNLRYLDIGSRSLGDQELKNLLDSPHWGPLETLGLAHSSLGDQALVELAQWPKLAGIKRLYLGENTFSLDGLKALIASPYIGQLRLLELGGLRVEDNSWVQALLDAPGLNQLEYIQNLDLTNVEPNWRTVFVSRFPEFYAPQIPNSPYNPPRHTDWDIPF